MNSINSILLWLGGEVAPSVVLLAVPGAYKQLLLMFLQQ